MATKFMNPQCKKLQRTIAELENYITSCEESAKSFDVNTESGKHWFDKWNERANISRKELAQAKADLEIVSKEKFVPTDEFFTAEIERLHEKVRKWDLNKILDVDSNCIPRSNGYFGDYTLITYCGRQAIVYVDDRDALVKFMTPFYDEIYYGYNKGGKTWDADERYNSGDCGIKVRNGELYNFICKKSKGKPYCGKWYKEISSKPINDSLGGFDAVNENGEHVRLSGGGWEIHDTTEEMAAAKAMTREEILEKWIKAGKLVVGGSGWEYRGARTAIIPTDKAVEMFPKYSFGKGFYEMEWTTYRGQVALSMREYSELDME